MPLHAPRKNTLPCVGGSPQSEMCEDISLGDNSFTTRSSPRNNKVRHQEKSLPNSNAAPACAAASAESASAGTATATIFNPATRVFRAVRHVHQTADKFQFEMLIEEVRIRLPNDTDVAVDWTRGTRRARTKDWKSLSVKTGGYCSWSNCEPLGLVVTLFRSGMVPPVKRPDTSQSPQKDKGTTGVSIFSRRRRKSNNSPRAATSAEECVDPGASSPSLSTLMQSISYTYHPKLASLKVLDMSGGVKAGNAPYVIGECRFDLAQYSGACHPSYDRVTLTLSKCLDGQASITFLIRCHSLDLGACSNPQKTLDDVDYLHAIRRSFSSFSDCSSISVSAMRKVDNDPAPIRTENDKRKAFRTASFGKENANHPFAAPQLNVEDVTNAAENLRKENNDTTFPTSDRRGGTTGRDTSVSFDAYQTLPRSNLSCPDAWTTITSGSGEMLNSERKAPVVAFEEYSAEVSASIRDRGDSTCKGCQTQGIPFLLERVKELESRIIEKEKVISAIKDREKAEIKTIEEAYAAEKATSMTVEQQLRTTLNERDEQMSRLLKQLEGLHEALKRAQRQEEIQAEQMESNVKRAKAVGATATASQGSQNLSSLENTLTEEIKMLKRRLREAAVQSNAFHQVLDLERSKKNKSLAELESRQLEDRRAWDFEKATLESRLASANDTIRQTENERQAAANYRTQTELEISGLRQQLTNTTEHSSLSQNLATAQKELRDALVSRDTLQRRELAKEKKLYQQLQMFATTAQQRQLELNTERQYFDTERRTLRGRIVELEQEISGLPRPSIVQRLNAQLNAASLQTQMSEMQQTLTTSTATPRTADAAVSPFSQVSIEGAAVDGDKGRIRGRTSSIGAANLGGMLSPNSDGSGWQYEGVSKGGKGVYDPRTAIGLAQRLVELEDELIKTKLSLAESETARGQEADKLKKKNLVLSEQSKQYSFQLSDLEAQISDMKLKGRLSKSTNLLNIKGLGARVRKTDKAFHGASDSLELIPNGLAGIKGDKQHSGVDADQTKDVFKDAECAVSSTDLSRSRRRHKTIGSGVTKFPEGRDSIEGEALFTACRSGEPHAMQNAIRHSVRKKTGGNGEDMKGAGRLEKASDAHVYGRPKL